MSWLLCFLFGFYRKPRLSSLSNSSLTRPKTLYAQAALLVESDYGGFVASVTPAPDAFRNLSAGAEVEFLVNMSATAASAVGSGEVTLSFQGHKVSRSCFVFSASCEYNGTSQLGVKACLVRGLATRKCGTIVCVILLPRIYARRSVVRARRYRHRIRRNVARSFFGSQIMPSLSGDCG